MTFASRSPDDPSGRRLLPGVSGVAVGVLLTAHAILLAWSAYKYAPATDEPGHLVAGISHWRFGRFDLYRVTPPLVRLVAAAPVMLADPATDWTSYRQGPTARPDVSLGIDFTEANGPRTFWLTTIARWACLPFAVTGGLVCYLWARDLYGPASGVLAAALWCFSPDVLGHGCLITTDVAGASLSVATFYAAWLWLKQGGWSRAFAMGLFLGLAQLTKATFVIYYGLIPGLWALWMLLSPKPGPGSWPAGLLQLVASFLVSIVVLNSAYGYDGSFKPLGDYRFISRSFAGDDLDGIRTGNRFSDTVLAHVPVPLPEQYVLGIDFQKRYFDRGLRSYLRGEWKVGGWWYYFLYGLAIKVPLGTWVLVIIAACVSVTPQARATRLSGVVVLLPALAIVAFVSSQTGFNKSLRYVLAAQPFLFVWASQSLSRVALNNRWASWAAAGAAAWAVASSLSVYPHSMSYFNEAVGGPTRGHEHLIHTNIDFGQDLLYLKDWLDEHPTREPLYVAYYGTIDPVHAGISHSLPRPDPATNRWPRGRYAISVNLLRGHKFPVTDGEGNRLTGVPDYSSFLDRKPTGMAGYSIYIYDLTD